MELTRRIERHNAEGCAGHTQLLAVPGIGTLTASALAAELGAGAAAGYTSGRQYAACKGITPRMSGTGGKVRTGVISKRGDPYVRTLLIHGARSVIITHQRNRAKRLSPWLKGLLERGQLNVAVVALANKMARTAWALAAHGRSYQEHYVAASGVADQSLKRERKGGSSRQVAQVDWTPVMADPGCPGIDSNLNLSLELRARAGDEVSITETIKAARRKALSTVGRI